MQKLLSNLPENVKLVISSLSPLIIVGILFALVGQFGISKVVDVRNQIAKAEKDQAILTQKLTLLKSISGTINESTRTSLAVLPDTNPSLIMMSQLKIISSSNSVLISGVKSGTPINDSSGLFHVDISFQVSGTRSQVISFLNNISLIAPITIVDKVKITESAGAVRADVTTKSYWSSLPKTLPVMTSPITDLTTAEKKIVTDIGSLTQPTFVNVPSSSESGKIDPFSK